MPALSHATALTPDVQEDIDRRFQYQSWNAEQIEKGEKVRAALKAAFEALIEHVPPCADRGAALRHIIDARMSANSAISFNGKY